LFNAVASLRQSTSGLVVGVDGKTEPAALPVMDYEHCRGFGYAILPTSQ
jgi:hypothetical protein